MKKIIALIPARSGSKRVKNKNINLLNNHPLIAYTIQCAIQSNIFDKIIVSTDSEKIRQISEYYGATVPFLRPNEYALDTSPDFQFVKHAIDFFNSKKKNFDFFSILRPTSPFRKPATIIRAYEQFLSLNCDSLRAVEKCLQHPCKMWVVDGGYMNPFITLNSKGPLSQPLHSSQYPTLPEVYVQNASLEIAKTEVIFEHKNISGSKIIPFFTENDEGIDVNVEEDWLMAKILLQTGKAKLPAVKLNPYSEK